MKVCRIKKSENNGNARLSIRIHYQKEYGKKTFLILNKVSTICGLSKFPLSLHYSY